ncbi:MAG: hypothetical protein RR869_03295 [Lachnospiraceae bacterium]
MVCIGIYLLLVLYMILKKKKKLPENCYGKTSTQIFGCLLAANTLAFLLLVIDTGGNSGGKQERILRNHHGRGTKTEELQMTIPGKVKREPVKIKVQEQAYTKKEIQALFKKVVQELDTVILGKNKSKDRVETNLNLIQTVPDTGISMEWALNRYDVMNIYGELQKGELKEEGTLVEIRGVMHYDTEEALYVTNVRIYPLKKTGNQKVVSEVQKMTEESDRQTKEQKALKLPTTWKGEKVIWTKPVNRRGYVVLALGGVGAGLLLLLKKQKEYKKRQERRQQMMLDYPEIVNKFMLLLGAGMTVKNAWKKIVSDYAEQREILGMRYAYEEMNQTLRQMQGGVTEAESYERFGKRCGLQPYLKLGALLSQNLRKGTKGLSDLLQLEAIQAFEERKNLAKRLGEEASTKLLVPMFFMLAIVLVIVIVPAFLSVQI